MTTSLEPDELRRLLDEAAAGPTTARFDNVFRRAHRRRQAWRSGLVAATVAVVAVAIVVPTLVVSSNTPSRPSTVPIGVPSPAARGVRTDPLSLVGRWHLAAAGETKDTTLIIGDQLLLFRPCGLLEGEWRADQGGLFVGDLNAGDGTCFHSAKGFDASWLAHAVSYRSAGPDRLLLNASGQIVARLSPGARPTTPMHGDLPSFADVPTVTPALRAMLRSPAALPDGLRPVTPGDILGRWQPLQTTPRSPDRPFVAFNTDGSWSGSDGCNGYGGRFAVGSAGELLTTSDGSTLVGCLGSMAPNWVVNARRVGLDGSQLVLFDTNGVELGRLVRQPTAEVLGSFARVGGSPSASPFALSGDIEVHLNTRTGPVLAHAEAVNGHFEVEVPAGGRYFFTGTSPQVNGGRSPGCASFRATSAVAGHTVHVAIDCEIF